jgi:HK97 family phage portal protein
MPTRVVTTITNGPEPTSLIGPAREWVRSFTIGPQSLRDPELKRLFGRDSAAPGVHVTEQSMLSLSAVWAGMTAIASTVATLPLITYRREPGGGKSRAMDVKLYDLLARQPNDEMTSVQFRSTLTQHAIIWGNGYAEIQRDGVGNPIALWPIHPSRVRVMRNEAGGLRYLVSNPVRGGEADFDPWYMLHLAGPSADGVVGYNLADIGGESLGVAKAMQQFSASFFANGMVPGGFLTMPKGLQPMAKQNVRESLEARHKGVGRAHTLALLEDGMTFTANATDPMKAQLVEARVFEIAEVARFLNIPPHKLRDLSKSSFSNIEQEALSFLSDTIQPWTTRWEQELEKKLLFRQERKRFVIEHLFDALLRGDSQQRGDFYVKAIRNGWMSPNEVRARENLNPVAGGDTLLVSMDLQPLDRALHSPAPAEPTRTIVTTLTGADVRAERQEREERESRERQRRFIACEAKQRDVMTQIAEDEEARAARLAKEIRADLSPLGQRIAQMARLRREMNLIG